MRFVALILSALATYTKWILTFEVGPFPRGSELLLGARFEHRVELIHQALQGDLQLPKPGLDLDNFGLDEAQVCLGLGLTGLNAAEANLELAQGMIQLTLDVGVTPIRVE